MASRDVSEISEINKLIDFRKLIDYLATSAGQIVKLDSFARDNEVDKKTVDRWLTLLEYMFIVRRVRPWYRNNLKRLIKKPKLHLYDSGVLATILKVSEAKIRSDRGVFGQILEGFVFSELYKLIEQNDEGISIFHYRDLQQYEIDFMLELDGRIVAIEVKANIGIKSEDFKAMKRLKEAIGSSFACGIVLNTGDRIQRMGEKLYAMPVSQLWS